ncbi:RluA family pseudouridine synthase [Sandarakinorhabdus rubra]|uniref:RluA family pseudouridine synthase n=1 Tax=Sandarakinorhabdus rubra TaxID=2672568 RepID=UPI001F20F8DB|nr:RluA family pseudouridine synthase [Sandarakinorhabdus rubra]
MLPAILYRDPDIAILDKPSGLAVHPGPKTPHSLEDLLPALAKSQAARHFTPVAAHRLDRDTSGCIAIACSRRGARALSAAFAGGGAEKVYWAILSALPAASEGLIDAPLKKISSAQAGWRMVVAADGQRARTAWRVLDAGARLVEFRPETGRTHQIRVHAAHIGCPISGDPVYGDGAGQLRLHARRLAISLPDGRRIQAEAPLPADWQAFDHAPGNR